MTSGFSTHFHQRGPYQASSPFIDGLQKPQQTADLLAFLEITGGFNSRRLHQLDPPCRLGGLGPARALMFNASRSGPQSQRDSASHPRVAEPVRLPWVAYSQPHSTRNAVAARPIDGFLIVAVFAATPPWRNGVAVVPHPDPDPRVGPRSSDQPWAQGLNVIGVVFPMGASATRVAGRCLTHRLAKNAPPSSLLNLRSLPSDPPLHRMIPLSRRLPRLELTELLGPPPGSRLASPPRLPSI